SVSAGPPDESAQALNFIVSNDNTALFTVQPAIAPDGTLTYTSAPNEFGAATVTVRLHDDGGTANSGIDTSAAQVFTITVNPVNDAPSFVKGPDQSVPLSAGAQSVPNWATSLSAGPANESFQSLAFSVRNDNNAIFSVQPAVSPAGTLTFTPSTTTSGSATVSVRIHDSGGTANGGVDTSAPQAFLIVVGGQTSQSPPVATDDDASGNDGAPIVVPVLSNDSDPDEDTLTVTNVTTPSHGTAVINPDKTITYTSSIPYNGPDSFQYTISDGHGHFAAAFVHVTVTHVNHAPVANNDSYIVKTGDGNVLTVLANDSDPDNLAGSVVSSVPFLPPGITTNMSFAG